MPHRLIAAARGALVALAVAAASPALAAEPAPQPPRAEWTFSGPFGTFDRGQLQRGFKVYREVCAACHAMSLVAFRTLSQPGGPEFSEEQIRLLAAEYQITDGPDANGESFERPGRPSDRFPSTFPNEQAARAAMGGAYPPDFSVLAKARTYERGFPLFLMDIVTQYTEQGPDYIRALLVGYEDAPDGEERPGLYYNRYFPGHWIAMAPPVAEGQIEYDDGAPTTVDQYAKDVTAFMMWAAEPHLEARKAMGFKVMVFLIVFAGLLYFTKKKIWSRVHDGEAHA